ncbi:limbic system-associated membrane protein-like [Corticium candelabrum]|uniref:limbic system-associated membrane protein-like n=1 Tax=Corticium candelabrum TaxID=121492 RepID=UPI002E2569E6|nr:limbic system-associated membrane protein-like [Corticium candelabrum]XP_062499585.1 limbic system-associated membrane protein-like [Corticium candelabrum]
MLDYMSVSVVTKQELEARPSSLQYNILQSLPSVKTKNATVMLEVGVPPDASTDLIAKKKTNVSINLSWTPGFNNFSPIHGYKVTYRVSGSNHWKTARNFSGGTAEEQLVCGLEPLTSYEFRVRARNYIGKGKHSEIGTLTTHPNIAPTITKFVFSNANELGSVTIECASLDAKPVPTYMLIKQKETGKTLKRVTGKSLLSYTISNVTKTDTGLYECVGSNKAGVGSKTEQFTVQYTPVTTILQNKVNTIDQTDNSLPL